MHTPYQLRDCIQPIQSEDLPSQGGARLSLPFTCIHHQCIQVTLSAELSTWHSQRWKFASPLCCTGISKCRLRNM